MKILRAHSKNRALSLPELVVIMAVVGLLVAVFILPAVVPRRTKAIPINCVNHLKQVALAFRLWAGDNGEQYPMAAYTNATGGPAFSDSSNAFRYFQIMSNEFSSAKILLCPMDGERQFATNFTSDFNNLRVSYFVGLSLANPPPICSWRGIATSPMACR